MTIDIKIGKCEEVLKEQAENSVDLLVTDPPYGYSFMGKDWDKTVIPTTTWAEILRVLKPGAFGFVMCAPRQDVFSQLLHNLQNAGFNTGFSSIYWTYQREILPLGLNASGFPKATNASKQADRTLGAERAKVRIPYSPHEVCNPKVVGGGRSGGEGTRPYIEQAKKDGYQDRDSDVPVTEEAKKLQGAYLGYQPKPAVEIIAVVMKPHTEKSYIAQAMANGKAVTWLDDARIPAENIGNRTNTSSPHAQDHVQAGNEGWGKTPNKLTNWEDEGKGRFPANLLVSDGVLDAAKCSDHPAGNRGKITKVDKGELFSYAGGTTNCDYHGNAGTFSDYFSLDRWWEALPGTIPEEIRDTFPFLAVPKPAKREKEKGLAKFEAKTIDTRPSRVADQSKKLQPPTETRNYHPTVKPLQLFSYLITMGSRPGDLVLDPFAGSGTSGIAAKILRRNALLVEMNPEYAEIAKARVRGNPADAAIDQWVK